jgi:hypothetical protein
MFMIDDINASDAVADYNAEKCNGGLGCYVVTVLLRLMAAKIWLYTRKRSEYDSPIDFGDLSR